VVALDINPDPDDLIAHAGIDPISERTDPVNLELDGLAGLEPAIELEASAADHTTGKPWLTARLVRGRVAWR
jgi:hypothetical protein